MFVCLNWEWLYIFCMIEKQQKKKNILWPVKITWNSTYLFIGTRIYWHTASPFVYESSIAKVMPQELSWRVTTKTVWPKTFTIWSFTVKVRHPWGNVLKGPVKMYKLPGKSSRASHCLSAINTQTWIWLFNLFQSPRKGPKKMDYQYKKKFY